MYVIISLSLYIYCINPTKFQSVNWAKNWNWRRSLNFCLWYLGFRLELMYFCVNVDINSFLCRFPYYIDTHSKIPTLCVKMWTKPYWPSSVNWAKTENWRRSLNISFWWLEFPLKLMYLWVIADNEFIIVVNTILYVFVLVWVAIAKFNDWRVRLIARLENDWRN